VDSQRITTRNAGKEGGPVINVDICQICAEHFAYYAVAECNHRTCHRCALRLRELYKTQNCSYCKVRNNFRHSTECTKVDPSFYSSLSATFSSLH
jgi:hypothetical protein